MRTLRSSSRRSARMMRRSAGTTSPPWRSDDVARHERRGRDDGDGPVAADPRDRRRGLAQRLERPLASVLGDDVGTDDRQQPGEYEQSVAHLADEHREHTSHREHEHERLRRPPRRASARAGRASSPRARWVRPPRHASSPRSTTGPVPSRRRVRRRRLPPSVRGIRKASVKPFLVTLSEPQPWQG